MPITRNEWMKLISASAGEKLRSEWVKIANAAGGLPADARDEIESAVLEYLTDQGAEYSCVTNETREAVKKNKKRLTQVAEELTLLDARPDFRKFNVPAGAAATSLNGHLRALAELQLALDSALKRLAKRSRKNWQRVKLRALIIELLEIRTWHIKTDVPIHVNETTNSGTFHAYLALCLELAEPHSNKAERAELLKHGIGLAVDSFRARRTDPQYCWQWGDLFPESEPSLWPDSVDELSSRFLT